MYEKSYFNSHKIRLYVLSLLETVSGNILVINQNGLFGLFLLCMVSLRIFSLPCGLRNFGCFCCNVSVLSALIRFSKTWRAGKNGAEKNLLLVNKNYRKVFDSLLSTHEHSGSKGDRKNGDMQELKIT